MRPISIGRVPESPRSTPAVVSSTTSTPAASPYLASSATFERHAAVSVEDLESNSNIANSGVWEPPIWNQKSEIFS